MFLTYTGNIKSGVKIFNVTGTLVEDDSMKLVSTSKKLSKGTISLPRNIDLINSVLYVPSTNEFIRYGATSNGWVDGSYDSQCYLSSITSSAIKIYVGATYSNSTLYYSYWE